MTPAPESPDAAREPVPLTDERIDFIAETVIKGMPDGIQGFLRAWGWRQFARALLEDCAGHYREPDAITRLTADRDAALRDAERYRWLRDKAPGEIVFDHINDDNHFMLIVPFDGEPVHNDEHSGMKLDEAIDAALSAQERGNV